MAAAKSVCFNIVGAVFYMLLLIVVLTENRFFFFAHCFPFIVELP